ncbi:MAG: hypothetical protein AAF740_13825, partial [Bacteroidota bacterium]
MKKLAVFKQFSDLTVAEDTAAQLREHEILVKLSQDIPSVDVTFTGGAAKYQIELSIPTEDFERAEAILLDNVSLDLTEVDPSHYLFEFSENELRDVLIKADEWHPTDVAIAKEI